MQFYFKFFQSSGYVYCLLTFVLALLFLPPNFLGYSTLWKTSLLRNDLCWCANNFWLDNCEISMIVSNTKKAFKNFFITPL